MAALITDYFNCLQLEFSKTVFEPETGYVSTSIYIYSLHLIDQLNIDMCHQIIR